LILTREGRNIGYIDRSGVALSVVMHQDDPAYEKLMEELDGALEEYKFHPSGDLVSTDIEVYSGGRKKYSGRIRPYIRGSK
jgi:hypothetical protein